MARFYASVSRLFAFLRMIFFVSFCWFTFSYATSNKECPANMYKVITIYGCYSQVQFLYVVRLKYNVQQCLLPKCKLQKGCEKMQQSAMHLSATFRSKMEKRECVCVCGFSLCFAICEMSKIERKKKTQKGFHFFCQCVEP